MKPATVFLGEMTNPEVETFLKTHDTVIIPTGATEQHGPHGPLATDVLIPNEIARRVAPPIGAVVAPPITYTLSYPHVGFTGMVHIRIPTFMSLIEDLCASFAASGFRRIVFLNGHYDNTYAIAYACANAAERMPKGVKAFPVNYWDALTAERGRGILGAEERPACQPGRDLGGDGDQPGSGGSGQARTPSSRPSRLHGATSAPSTRRSSSATPVRCTGRQSRGHGAIRGRRRRKPASATSQAGVRSTLALLDNIERTFAAMPPR